MSKYSGYETTFDDQECLVGALVDNGKTPEVCEQGRPLIGYQGDQRKEIAHIIIDRQQVGGASNEIGFKRESGGKFTAIISAYDRGRYNDAWLQKVETSYGEKKTIKTLKAQGYTEFEVDHLKNPDGTARSIVRAKIPPKHLPAQQVQTVGIAR